MCVPAGLSAAAGRRANPAFYLEEMQEVANAPLVYRSVLDSTNGKSGSGDGPADLVARARVEIGDEALRLI